MPTSFSSCRAGRASAAPGLRGPEGAGTGRDARRGAGASRLGAWLLAGVMAAGLGVRGPRVKAFATGSYAGEGRLALSLTSSDTGEVLDADVGLSFSTATSTRPEGLRLEAAFRWPQEARDVRLVLDLERRGGKRAWTIGADATATLTVTNGAPAGAFDGVGTSGELALEAAFVRDGVLGFRVGGVFEVVDPGPDGLLGTDDDRAFEVVVTAESRPTAEDIAGDWQPVDECGDGRCWEPAASEPGCAGEPAVVVYEPSTVGCWDWVDDVVDDDDDWSDDDWGDDEDDWSDDDDDDWGDDVDDNGNGDSGVDDNGNPT